MNLVIKTTLTLLLSISLKLSNFSIDRGENKGPILKETLNGIEATTPAPVTPDTTKETGQ